MKKWLYGILAIVIIAGVGYSLFGSKTTFFKGSFGDMPGAPAQERCGEQDVACWEELVRTERTNVETLTDAVSQLEAQIANEERLLAMRGQEIQRKQTFIRELDAKIRSTKTKLDRAKIELTKAKKTGNQQRIATAQNLVAALEAELTALQEKAAGERRDLQTSQNSYAQEKTALNNHKADLKQLHRQLQDAQDRLRDAERGLERAQRPIFYSCVELRRIELEGRITPGHQGLLASCRAAYEFMNQEVNEESCQRLQSWQEEGTFSANAQRADYTVYMMCEEFFPEALNRRLFSCIVRNPEQAPAPLYRDSDEGERNSGYYRKENFWQNRETPIEEVTEGDNAFCMRRSIDRNQRATTFHRLAGDYCRPWFQNRDTAMESATIVYGDNGRTVENVVLCQGDNCPLSCLEFQQVRDAPPPQPR